MVPLRAPAHRGSRSAADHPSCCATGHPPVVHTSSRPVALPSAPGNSTSSRPSDLRPFRPLVAVLQTTGAVAVCRAGATRPQAPTGTQGALSRPVVHLDANAVRILEQHGVVARRELRSLFGRVDDARLELIDQKTIDRIDVLATTGAKAEMMQAGTVLVERGGPFCLRGATHHDAG